MRVRIFAVAALLLLSCGGRISGEDLIQGSNGTASADAPTAGVAPEPAPALPPPTPPSPGKPPAAPAKYTASAFAGGLDHVFVTKADYASDTCIRIHLRRPSESAPRFASISTPDEWGVSIASKSKGASACAPQSGAAMPTPATAGKGVITWSDGGTYLPCAVDLSVGLDFGGSIETLYAKNVPVAGCQ